MDSFSLDIDLGNAAMSDNVDVAQALREAADAVELGHDNANDSGVIIDGNGNHVGGWGFNQLADKRPDNFLIVITETIEATLDGAAEAFNKASEDIFTGREVAALIEATKKTAAPEAARNALR